MTLNLVPPWEDEVSMPATTEAWRWKAPELIGTYVDGQESVCRVTTATDVYAFAMAVIEVRQLPYLFASGKFLPCTPQVLTGCVPFSHIKNDAKVVITVVEGGRPRRTQCSQITDDIWKVLEMCWNAEPEQRPSMDAVFRFFKLQSLYAQPARL